MKRAIGKDSCTRAIFAAAAPVASRAKAGSGAFSLVELLIVIGIMAALLVLSLPSLSGILGGSKLGIATESIAGALSSARQLAAAKNREVEFRLITMKNRTLLSSSTDEMRAIQILEVVDGALRPIIRPRVLPDGVIVGSSTSASSLAALPSVSATSDDSPISGVGTGYSYRVFRFRPDGSIDLKMRLPNPGDGKYFLTLFDEKTMSSGDALPSNFATIRLEPATGAYTVYRP